MLYLLAKLAGGSAGVEIADLLLAALCLGIFLFAAGYLP